MGCSGIPDILATRLQLHLPPVVWWVVLYLAVGPTAICFFLIQYASLRLPAPKVIAYGYLTPAFVILFEAHRRARADRRLAIIAGATVTVSGWSFWRCCGTRQDFVKLRRAR